MKSGDMKKKFFDEDPSKVLEYLIPIRAKDIYQEFVRAINGMKNLILINELHPMKLKCEKSIENIRKYILNSIHILFATEDFSLTAAAEAIRKVGNFKVYRLKRFPTRNGFRDLLICNNNGVFAGRKDYAEFLSPIISAMTTTEKEITTPPTTMTGMKLINATGHIVQIHIGGKFITLPISKTVIRSTLTKVSKSLIEIEPDTFIPVEKSVYSTCTLPEYREDTIYIVSKLTQEVLKRPDLVSPDDFVFGKQKRKIACKKLVSINI